MKQTKIIIKKQPWYLGEKNLFQNRKNNDVKFSAN